ncbi:hypothetical protein L9F63_028110, partial [Diploptera punctata]
MIISVFKIIAMIIFFVGVQEFVMSDEDGYGVRGPVALSGLWTPPEPSRELLPNSLEALRKSASDVMEVRLARNQLEITLCVGSLLLIIEAIFVIMMLYGIHN